MNFEVLDDFNGLEMGFISNNSGGYISKNKYLFENNIILTQLIKRKRSLEEQFLQLTK